jgi:voltage-gated potassium channel
MTTTAAKRAVLVRRWERASESPLLIAAVVFPPAYAVPILDPDLPSWLLELCRSLSWITWGIFVMTSWSGYSWPIAPVPRAAVYCRRVLAPVDSAWY